MSLVLSTYEDRFSKIPNGRRIRVLYDTKDFVVIEKPCNLRSVPGHADPPPPPPQQQQQQQQSSDDNNNNKNSIKKSKSPEGSLADSRRTAQESWVLAISSFHNETNASNNDDYQRNGNRATTPPGLVLEALRQLATMEKKLIESVPRKYNLFRRYVERNQKRLLGHFVPKEDLDTLANTMFECLEQRQRPLLNLPKPTSHEESAFGQLVLYGYDDKSKKIGDASSKSLRVVHRLDCETSGVMVFAKNEVTDSFLSKAWRERDRVTKFYIALVKDWPPYQRDAQKLKEGTIDALMVPSTERLKWKVVLDEKNNCGKSSLTHWKVLEERQDGIVLQLQPITGRTHQLRVHCAHIGSGIVGDSLYGSRNHSVDCQESNQSSSSFLHLHAWKLCFPDPSCDNNIHEFMSLPSWFDPEIKTE